MKKNLMNEKKLEIKFKVHMNSEVDKKVIIILNKLFCLYPLNELQKIRYILRNKKRMMGGTVAIPNLLVGRVIIYLDYPGFFKENDKHNYQRKEIKYFDEEDFNEAVIHETIHAWQILNYPNARNSLKRLLVLDKKLKKNHSKLIVENERFLYQIHLEGLAQFISLREKYFKSNKKNFSKNYKENKRLLQELINSINNTKKREITRLFNLIPYRLGPHIYYSLNFLGKIEIVSLSKLSPSDLIIKYESVMKKNKLTPLFSYESRKGVYDYKENTKKIELI